MVDFLEKGSSFTITLGENKAGCEITGKTESEKNKIHVNFKTPLDSSTLTLSNIEPADDLIEKYITPFFDHVSQIISSKEEIEAAIVEFVEKFDMSEFENSKLEVQTKESPIRIQMANENNTVKELLILELEEMKIKLKNIYFETNFEITVPTKHFLDALLGDMFHHVFVNYNGIKKLTSNQLEGGKTEKEINCDVVKEILEANNKFNDVEFSVDGGNIKFDDHSFKYECEDLTDTHALIITMSNEDDTINMSLPVLKHSLYDLQPAVESFYRDAQEIFYKTMVEKTEDNIEIYEGGVENTDNTNDTEQPIKEKTEEIEEQVNTDNLEEDERM